MDETLARKIAVVMRVATGALFVYAGGIKTLDLHEFAIQVANYRILPHALSVAVALYLPWLELLCGGCLLFKVLHRGTLIVIGMMMLVFTAALGSAWARGLRISCGCFGSNQGIGDYGIDLLRDIAILACIAFLWRRSRAEAG
jgi:uncharacterized membrane protein YphA (DoxX/SURF4 family)